MKKIILVLCLSAGCEKLTDVERCANRDMMVAGYVGDELSCVPLPGDESLVKDPEAYCRARSTIYAGDPHTWGVWRIFESGKDKDLREKIRSNLFIQCYERVSPTIK